MPHVVRSPWDWLLPAKCVSESGTGTKKLKVKTIFEIIPTLLSTKSHNFNVSKWRLCWFFNVSFINIIFKSFFPSLRLPSSGVKMWLLFRFLRWHISQEHVGVDILWSCHRLSCKHVFAVLFQMWIINKQSGLLFCVFCSFQILKDKKLPPSWHDGNFHFRLNLMCLSNKLWKHGFIMETLIQL